MNEIIKLIPEEYREQFLNLIESNNVVNWDLSYQLLTGLFDQVDPEDIYRTIMWKYCKTLDWDLKFELKMYLLYYEYKYGRNNR